MRGDGANGLYGMVPGVSIHAPRVRGDMVKLLVPFLLVFQFTPLV